MDGYVAMEAPEESMLRKWGRIREIRELVNKEIEVLRVAGQVGASLQAEVTLTLAEDDFALLSSLGADVKFVFITSAIYLVAGSELSIRASVTKGTKCERCWHYCDDIGADAAHPTLCGRCAGNLSGRDETRLFA
jgi:isoleucyl-tRNA synthetase